MIVAYEPFSTKLNHVPVNTEFLSIIAEKFNTEKVVFYGEQQHVNSVETNISASNIEYREINIIEPMTGRIRSVLNEGKNIRWLIRQHEKEIKLFIILNSHPHSIFFAKKYIPENIPIVFIVHGNIEELKRNKHFFQLGYWIKPAFRYRYKRKNMKYVVLGDSIRKNLLTYVNFIENDLVSVPHPYSLYYRNSSSVKKSTKERITLGMIGSFSPEKRSEMIFDLERKVRENGIKNINYLLVGSSEMINIPNNSEITFFGNDKSKLSNKAYNEGIDILDFILFFWPKDSYKLTASGALCDAIVHNKPIISTKNDYLTWVFDKVGDLGFLCDDLDQMASIICQIANGELKEKINGFHGNFNNARAFFSRENVGKIMEEKKVWML